MRRWLAHIFAAVGVVVGIGVAVMWVRGNWRHDYIFYCGDVVERSDGHSVSGFSSLWMGNSVRLRRERLHGMPSATRTTTSFSIPERGWHWNTNGANAYRESGKHQWLGFGWSRAQDQTFALAGGKLSTFSVLIPYWFLALLGAPSILWLLRAQMRWMRQSRIERGLCAVCGYDMRATPGRCPECGKRAQACGE